ncbi:2'-5' RNA ligase family protein [Actinomadura sp. LD22]|uniref:2'-5' RNA ligase family protein n=1 Tax=Actinomadura physcomitrii TaxID=2650748 RepID=A0A6I4MBM5_9ACTN|nr:2'-5' RNA ligase family protein [Actinomadura physcomitrii]MWA02335.1 2'-5' RNA ligase family protein [Actinomadura physcomitrii]MWA03093.1 2'-5' RNA ligase family protein [Actinomadura physcomitrii]
MSPLPARMNDHWWWRPGVRPGRRLLVWHILPDDQTEARDLARQCQDKLAGLEGLDLIPSEWLHVTTQIVGFDDEITPAEADAMTAGVAERFAALSPVDVSLARVWLHSEAIMLGIEPPRALDPVRTAIRDAVAGSVRVHQLADEPNWTPHMSVAYSNTEGPATPVIKALDLHPDPAPLRVSEVHLVAQERVGRLYRWERRAAVPLGES